MKHPRKIPPHIICAKFYRACHLKWERNTSSRTRLVKKEKKFGWGTIVLTLRG